MNCCVTDTFSASSACVRAAKLRASWSRVLEKGRLVVLVVIIRLRCRQRVLPRNANLGGLQVDSLGAIIADHSDHRQGFHDREDVLGLAVSIGLKEINLKRASVLIGV